MKVLKYSEGQAARRVSACRLLRELPELAEHIQKGELNLTQLNQAKGFFQEMGVVAPEQKIKIIEDIKGKTIQETEAILSKKREGKPSKKVTIILNKKTVEALKNLQGLKAHSCPDLDSVIMKMVETVSKTWDAEVIHRKRKIGEGKTRFVQAGVRAEVWRRDQSKCTHCGSKYALQIDHIKPFALGGKTLPANLRLLCRNCNQRKGLEAFPSVFHRRV